MKKFWIGSDLNLSKKIHIIGAGISGLAAGYAFKKAGLDFEIHEATGRVGGKLGTIKTKYGLVETAANAVLLSRDLESLVSELGLKPIAATKGLKRLIFRNGRLKGMPYLSVRELFRVFHARNNLVPEVNNETTVYDFFFPLLGEEVCDEVLSAALAGVYTVGARELNFKAIFGEVSGHPTYWQYFKILKAGKEKIHSASFAGGMQALVDALEEKLKGHLKLHSKIDKLLPNSLVCVSPNEAAQYAQHAQLKQSLNAIELPKVVSHTFFTDKKIKKLAHAFGILFTNRDELGILANGEIFPANNPSPSYTLISKVEKDPDQFCYFVKECFGQEVSVLDHFNKSWSTGIPLYNHTLLQSQKVLRENREMALWGNYVDKISLRELLVKPWQAV